MSKKRSKKENKEINGGSMPDDAWAMPIDMPSFDPRMMEKMMADLTQMMEDQDFATEEEAEAFLERFLESGQRLPERKPETPLEKAQALVYKAWETDNPRRRVHLAQKALRLSKDCADAYIILAEETAESLEEGKAIYEQAMEAGERAMGPDAFSRYEGHFWLAIETRPYMRARLELAMCLWYLEESRESLAHLQEMLQLNPNDNQGIRYILLPHLLSEGLHEEAKQLLADYEEDISALFLYSHALMLFVEHGRGRKADSHLRTAMEANPYVPDLFLGRVVLPQELPPFSGLGDPLEAAHYFLDALPLWLRTRGAIDWLRDIAPDSKERAVH